MGALAAGVALLFMHMHHAVHKVVHHVRLNVRAPSLQHLFMQRIRTVCRHFRCQLAVFLGLNGRLMGIEAIGARV